MRSRNMLTKNQPVPGTGKRLRFNPEKRAWKGRSYRKGGMRVRDLRAAEVTS